MRGTLEESVKNDIDGALIPVTNFGLVRDPAVIRDAIGRMALLKVPSGGYRRVRSTYTDPKIFEYRNERQGFPFVDLALAELVTAGRVRKVAADAMLDRITAKAAADHNIIPETYVALPCELSRERSAIPPAPIPMVGYGAGAYILHLLNLGRPCLRPATRRAKAGRHEQPSVNSPMSAMGGSRRLSEPWARVFSSGGAKACR